MTSSVRTSLRGENDTKQSYEIQAKCDKQAHLIILDTIISDGRFYLAFSLAGEQVLF